MDAIECGYVYGSVYVIWNNLSVVNKHLNKQLKEAGLTQNKMDQLSEEVEWRN